MKIHTKKSVIINTLTTTYLQYFINLIEYRVSVVLYHKICPHFDVRIGLVTFRQNMEGNVKPIKYFRQSLSIQIGSGLNREILG